MKLEQKLVKRHLPSAVERHLRNLLNVSMNMLLCGVQSVRQIEEYLPCKDHEFVKALELVERKIGEVVQSKFGGE